MLKVSNI